MKNVVSLFYPDGYSNNERSSQAKRFRDFAVNLELEYIASIISPHHQEYALRILSELNTDHEVIKYRQAILQDFMDNPQLESVLTGSIQTLFGTYKTANVYTGSTHSFFELNENVQAIKVYIDCMEEFHKLHVSAYGKFKSAGIRKLMDLFEESYNSAHFARIKEEIELISEKLATGIKSVTVGINLDDMMRPFEAALIRVDDAHFREKKMFDRFLYKNIPENSVDSLYSSINKSGGVVESNKALFSELTKVSFDFMKHLNIAFSSFYKVSTDYIIELVPQINYYTGLKKLAERLKYNGLPVCLPEIASMGGRVTHVEDMYDLAFVNKYMASVSKKGKNGKGKDKSEVALNDCVMDDNGRIFILTGPNNGGKTTYARGVGICHVLAQAGAFIPGRKAYISPADNIFTHFPREEEIGINTSRFTEECKELKVTAENATEYSMVLLNESISSTTPSECIFVAEEILKILNDIVVRSIYVTHMFDLAFKADEINQSVKGKSKIVSIVSGCDEKGDRNYKITKSLPLKSSYAADILKKYGINYENYKKIKK